MFATQLALHTGVHYMNVFMINKAQEWGHPHPTTSETIMNPLTSVIKMGYALC
jgi:hypothetical protein